MAKKTLTMMVDCDTDRLYGPIADAIVYLREIAAAHPDQVLSLHEHWTGYEDMEMCFVYQRLETDDEFAERRKVERKEAAEARRKEEAEQARMTKQAQVRKMARDLGMEVRTPSQIGRARNL